EALRSAFDATMKDKAYLAEAEKLKIDVDPLTGAELAALVDQVSRTPADTVARVRAALEQRCTPAFATSDPSRLGSRVRASRASCFGISPCVIAGLDPAIHLLRMNL